MSGLITFLRLGDYGRLGNQLFQIGATVGLGARTGRTPLFPDWEYAPWLNVPTADSRVLEETNWVTQRPAGFAYDPLLAASEASDVNLEGYLQSEKYFENARSLVRAGIMSDRMSGISEETGYRHRIGEDNDCCAVHIRRSDYVALSDLYFQLTPENYYRAAMARMRAAGVRRFIVVSDDLVWARRALTGPGIEFSQNTGTLRDRILASQRHRQAAKHISFWSAALERYAAVRVLADLLLMARCRHHIIANSSFSWWSSWLSASEDRLVIAPRNWFTSKLGHDTNDLYRADMTLM